MRIWGQLKCSSIASNFNLPEQIELSFLSIYGPILSVFTLPGANTFLCSASSAARIQSRRPMD